MVGSSPASKVSGWWGPAPGFASGIALAFVVHFFLFGSWETFHASIDWNRGPFEDFMGPYYKQALAMRGDQALEPGFLYPPSFALLLWPFAYLSGAAASWTWLAILGLASIWLLATIWRWLPRSTGGAAFGLSLCFGLGFPWVHDMHWGQVSTLLWAFTLAGLLAWKKQQAWLAAVLLSVAISIKLFPAWFLLAFAMKRDWQGIGRVLLLTSVWMLALPLFLMGGEATGLFYQDLASWWRGSLKGLFWQSEGSQFAPAVLYRMWNAPQGILGMLVWVLPYALAAWIVIQSWRCMSIGREHVGLVLLASALPLVLSPSWSHYYVWLPWGLFSIAQWMPTRWVHIPLVCAAILMSTPFFLLVGGHPSYPIAGYLTLAALLIPFAYHLGGGLWVLGPAAAQRRAEM